MQGNRKRRGSRFFLSRRKYMKKKLEDLTFADNGMFQAVLSDPQICAELVERLLGIQIERVEYPELEKAIKPFYNTKGVRLDVYIKDKNKVIDIELQSYTQRALGKRTRYYQSMIDMDSLMKGESYKKLKESYILFICKYDPFKDKNGKPFGLPRYTFKNVCGEENLVNLNDKSVKVVYNASAYEDEKDEKIRSLLRFVQTNEPGTDDFSSRLSAIVERLKENEKFKEDYAGMNIHDQDLIDDAKEEKAVETAKNMLTKKVGTLEQIAEITGLSLDQAQELQKQLAEDPNAPLEKLVEAVVELAVDY
ncbi:MAG: Rpn family recombination-promoting nuclease/putative transposase [Treponema sp.]|nr:Rpn family recombination-promoting nuclease/putative transposase [Treponema sp.]